MEQKKNAVSQRRLLYAAIIILVMAVVILGYANYRIDSARDAGLPQGEIVIHGLQNQDLHVPMSDVEKLPTVTCDATAPQSDGELIQVRATGPLLNTLLQKYGKTQQDFSYIRFTARDGYSIAVPSDILKNCPIILSYVNNGQPLEADWQPIRVIIPDERAMYWVKDMILIDCEASAEQVPAQNLVFLDTAATELPKGNCDYGGSAGQAIKVEDLINQYGDGAAAQDVWIKAGDGLVQNETDTNFMMGDIRMTGPGFPEFLIPNLPEGMMVHNVLSISYGTTAFCDYAEAKQVLPRVKQNGITGIPMVSVINQTKLAGSGDYIFTMVDGGSFIVDAATVARGLIYESGGSLVFTSAGDSGPVRMVGLLSIQPLS